MEFESILVSKALPDREFRQKAVIDVHRYITSLQPPASSYLRRHPFFKRDVPTPTRMSIHADTRKRLPRSGFVQTGFADVWGWATFTGIMVLTSGLMDSCAEFWL